MTATGHLGKPLLVGLVLAGRTDGGRWIFRAVDAARLLSAIAVVFQNDRLLPWRSAIGNVELSLEMLDVLKATRWRA